MRIFKTRIVHSVCLVGVFCLAGSFIDADRPGEEQPFPCAKSRLVFPDDELFVFYESIDGGSMGIKELAPSSSDLSGWDQSNDSSSITHVSDNLVGRRSVNVAKGVICHHNTSAVLSERAALWYFTDYNSLQLDIVASSSYRIKEKTVNLDCDAGTYYKDCNIAIHDLDNKVDGNERYVDEIVLGQLYRKDGSAKLGLEVLSSIFESNGSETFDIPTGPNYRQMSIEIGNFDGQGLPEIAVVLYEESDGGWVSLFQWDPDEHTITKSPTVYLEGSDLRAFDTACGDFDGDGVDELAVLSGPYVNILGTDGSLTFKLKSTLNAGASMVNGHWRLKSGLFHFDPSDGYGMNRRQLVVFRPGGVGLYESPSGISFSIFRIDDGFEFTLEKEINLPDSQLEVTNKMSNYFYPSCDIAVGNFIGHDVELDSTNNQVPRTDQILVSCQAGVRSGNVKCRIATRCAVYDPASSSSPLWDWHSEPVESLINMVDFQLVSCEAMDLDGDRYHLGAPAHIYIEGKNEVNTLMEEPPKHVDFLPVDFTNWDGDWEIINVSAYPDFHVVFGESNDSTTNTETESTSDHTIGGSVDVKASQTVKGGVPNILSAEVKLREEVKVEGHYSSHKKNWDSNRETRSTKLTLTTNESDVIYGTKHGVDLWRYPIINMTDDDGKNCFYEVVIPAKPYDFTSTSNTHYDWYQPIHINRCLLSYPDATTDFPSDMGEYFDDAGTGHDDLLSNHAMFLYEGNEAELELEWSSETGTGTEISHEHEISEDASFEVGFKTKARVEVEEEEESFSVNVGFNNSNSWGDATVSEHTVSKSKTITVSIPAIPLPAYGWGYSFTPVSYVTDTGYLKVSHAVNFDELVHDGPKWANHYGDHPDLSLNLPQRFLFSSSGENIYGDWDLNTDESRMEMCQQYLRYATADPVTGKYPLVVDVPTENDKLRLEARVYNLCLHDTVAAGTDVRFDHVLVDSRNLMEYPETRTPIGTTTLTAIEPRESLIASLEFTPTGMGEITPPDGAPANAVFGYRIYVVVDPDNEVPNEIHEWKTDTNIGVDGWSDDEGRLYHGNNEGYWPKGGVVFIDPASKEAETEEEEISKQDIYYLFFGEDGLGLKVDDQLLTDTMPLLHNHESYPLRVHLRSTSAHDEYHRVLVEVQRNGEQPQMLDEIIVRDHRMDTYVWTRWTPREMGRYSIKATIIGEEDSELKTTDEIILNVLEAVNTGWMLY